MLRKKIVMPILMACFALGAIGCDSDWADFTQKRKLLVARVDIGSIIQEDPEYQRMLFEQANERSEILKELVLKMKQAGSEEDYQSAYSEDEQQAIRQEQQAVREEMQARDKSFKEKWKKVLDEFIESKREVIRAHSESIALSKGIDLVLIDGKSYATVEWGGVDITLDVKTKLFDQSEAPQGSGDANGGDASGSPVTEESSEEGGSNE